MSKFYLYLNMWYNQICLKENYNACNIWNLKYLHILDIDELEIYESEFTSIMGRSGAGKSTLLKMIEKLIFNEEAQLNYDLFQNI